MFSLATLAIAAVRTRSWPFILRATGTLRVSPDIGLRIRIPAASSEQGRIKFHAAAYDDRGQGRCVVFCISREKFAVWYRVCENNYGIKHIKGKRV